MLCQKKTETSKETQARIKVRTILHQVRDSKDRDKEAREWDKKVSKDHKVAVTRTLLQDLKAGNPDRVVSKAVAVSREWAMKTAATLAEAAALDRVIQDKATQAWVQDKDKMIYKIPIDLPNEDDILI